MLYGYLLWWDRKSLGPHVHLSVIIKPWNNKHHAWAQHSSKSAKSENNETLPLGYLLEAEPQCDWEGDADEEVAEPCGCGCQTSHYTKSGELPLLPFIALRR